MSRFLSAHGYDPGPTQRPILAGLLSGLAGTLPATAVLQGFGSLDVEAGILGLSIPATLASGCGVMAISGAVYGRVVQRTANDRRGGWLFGAAFGFLLWMAGAVAVLPLLSGGVAPAGEAAIGIYLAMILWGATMGGLFPFVHRPLHATVDSERRGLGPAAVAKGPRAG